jgi:hypothetical protein
MRASLLEFIRSRDFAPRSMHNARSDDRKVPQRILP